MKISENQTDKVISRVLELNKRGVKHKRIVKILKKEFPDYNIDVTEAEIQTIIFENESGVRGRWT
jgi:hypothetical protein